MVEREVMPYGRKKMLYSERAAGDSRNQQTNGIQSSEEKRVSMDPVGWRKVPPKRVLMTGWINNQNSGRKQ